MGVTRAALRAPAMSGGGAAAEPFHAVAVDAATVLPLRGEVLRPGRGAEEARFRGDGASDTLHAAVFQGGALIAVASVIRERPPCSSAEDAWRVRGMATVPAMRERGIGAALLARCEAHAREHGGALLWCNARVGARALYERAGMSVVGERFEIPGIGEHYLMRKQL